MSDSNNKIPHISQQIWDMKYRLKTSQKIPIDKTPKDTSRRVARAIAKAEKKQLRTHWEQEFYKILENHEFLPAGRIIAGAGAKRKVTLFNCYVMDHIKDDMGSIFDKIKEAALTLQQGGGIGQDFSTIRPKGDLVKSVEADASGPVNFMNIWDAMCKTMMSAGARRGAMMATLRCDHPDIEHFITAKKDPAKLRMFNLSVLVTDAFMEAVKQDQDWPLVFNGKTYSTVKAKELWRKIMRANYDSAEPGVIFIDRINKNNLLNYCETIYSTNPCGEQPLPPYGACLLGSVNLTRLVTKPFTKNAALDEEKLKSLTHTAVRFLDNTIDISNYPLKAQQREAFNKRRIGLGVTGLADALVMLGKTYGSKQARKLAARWMKTISEAAFHASVDLAKEKGSFPLFDADQYLETHRAGHLPKTLRSKIQKHGLRNGLLTSIAPTGTISLYAGNVSSGIEPIFDFSYERKILDPDGTPQTQIIEDYAYSLYRKIHGEDTPLTEHFVTAQSISPDDHLAMQAAIQPHIDSAISKTINCPENLPFEQFENIYLSAWENDLKGCTTYRPNPITGSVLSITDASQSKAPSTGNLVPVSDSSLQKETGEIIYIAEPMERDEILSGSTYKLRWPGSDHAIYITINDTVRNGRRQPFEIFINSKNLEHYSWTVALTRMISAVFRRGGDISFVAEELKAIFDPLGGKWLKNRYVPSLQAAIGEIIENHMQKINFLDQESEVKESRGEEQTAVSLAPSKSQGEYCPKCSSFSLVFQEGCKTCYNCGKSDCS